MVSRINCLLVLFFPVLLFSACGSDLPAEEKGPSSVVSAQEENVLAEEGEYEQSTTSSKASESLGEKPEGSTVEASIAGIRSSYTELQQLLTAGTLRKDSLGFDCQNDPGGGWLLRYYDGKELVIAKLSEGGDHYWKTTHLYLKEGKPFFVFVESGYWSFGGPLAEPANTIDYYQEDRYYLHRGKLIRHLTKSWEEKSWEESPTGSQVPNEEVSLSADAVFPDPSVLKNIKTGKVDC